MPSKATAVLLIAEFDGEMRSSEVQAKLGALGDPSAMALCIRLAGSDLDPVIDLAGATRADALATSGRRLSHPPALTNPSLDGAPPRDGPDRAAPSRLPSED